MTASASQSTLVLPTHRRRGFPASPPCARDPLRNARLWGPLSLWERARVRANAPKRPDSLRPPEAIAPTKTGASSERISTLGSISSLSLEGEGWGEGDNKTPAGSSVPHRPHPPSPSPISERGRPAIAISVPPNCRWSPRRGARPCAPTAPRIAPTSLLRRQRSEVLPPLPAGRGAGGEVSPLPNRPHAIESSAPPLRQRGGGRGEGLSA